MNTASLKLCKELYEASGWCMDTAFIWMDLQDQEPFINNGEVPGILKADRTKGTYRDIFDPGTDWLPAYDLGFLLRKLYDLGPFIQYDLEARPEVHVPAKKFFICVLQDANGKKIDVREWADTPEDAIAKLCIALIKQGILPPPTPTNK